MAEVDKLIVRIEADMRQLKKSLKDTKVATTRTTEDMKKAFRGLQGSLGKATASVFNLRNAIIGIGVGTAVRSIIKTGMEIESLQIRLELLFGSVEEGAKSFDAMAEFASRVPFSLGEIQRGAGALAAVSEDSKELAKLLEITGNVAAASGLDFATTSLQIQRSFSAGIASAEIFKERAVRDMLGFSAGAEVSVEQTREAFERVFGKGGTFGNATDRLAQTLGGTLSMLGDKVFNFQRAINDEGFFAELTAQFNNLNSHLEENQDSVDNLARQIATGLVKATKALSDALVFVNDNFKAIVVAIGTIIGLKLVLFFTNLTKQLYLLAKALGVVTVAQKAFNAAVLRNPYVIAGVAAATAIGTITGAFAKLKDMIMGTTDAIEKNNDAVKEQVGNLGQVTIKPSARDQMLGGVFGVGKRATTEAEREIGINPELQKQQDAAREREKRKIQEAFEFEERFKDSRVELGLATEEYTDQMDMLDRAYKDNLITLEEYREAMTKLNIKIFESTEAGGILMDGLSRTMDALSTTMADALMHMGEGWKGFRNSLKGIVRDIIAQFIKLQMQAMITRAITGMGGGGSMFSSIGSLFGGGSTPTYNLGGYAQYGNTSLHSKQPFVVGERGPELFVPNTSGSIMSNAQSRKISGGGGVTVNQTLNFDVGVAQTVRSEILQLMPTIKQQSVDAVIDAKERGGRMADVFK